MELARLPNRSRYLFVGGGPKLVACLGDRREPQHLDGHRRTGHLDLLATVVDHRPDLAPCRTGHDWLTLVDKNRCDRAPTDVEIGLEHHALGASGRIGLQVFELGNDKQLVEKIVNSKVFER